MVERFGILRIDIRCQLSRPLRCSSCAASTSICLMVTYISRCLECLYIQKETQPPLIKDCKRRLSGRWFRGSRAPCGIRERPLKHLREHQAIRTNIFLCSYGHCMSAQRDQAKIQLKPTRKAVICAWVRGIFNLFNVQTRERQAPNGKADETRTSPMPSYEAHSVSPAAPGVAQKLCT